MTLQEAKERINELKPKIEYYTIKYYEDEQVISDFDFDTLMKELKQIEAEYPQLITTDSPTQKVGTSPIKTDQQLLQPFGEFLPYQIQWALPSFPAAPALGADAAKDSCGRLTEQAGEQGNENDADERHAFARHELFHALAFCAG